MIRVLIINLGRKMSQTSILIDIVKLHSVYTELQKCIFFTLNSLDLWKILLFLQVPNSVEQHLHKRFLPEKVTLGFPPI